MLDDCAVTIFSSEGYFTVYMLKLSLDIESSSLSKVLCVVFENQKLKGRFGNPFGFVLLNQNNMKDKKTWFLGDFDCAENKNGFCVFLVSSLD